MAEKKEKPKIQPAERKRIRAIMEKVKDGEDLAHLHGTGKAGMYSASPDETKFLCDVLARFLPVDKKKNPGQDTMMEILDELEEEGEE